MKIRKNFNVKTIKGKNILMGILAVLMLPVLCFGCMALTSSKVLTNAISELTYSAFYTETDNYTISLNSGKREEPYKQDGKSEKLVPFAILTVNQKTEPKVSSGTYELTVKNKKYTGEFTQNPINKTLVADLGILIENETEIKGSVKIRENDNIILVNVLNKNAISTTDIVKIIENDFKPLIKAYSKNGRINGEIYIKILFKDTAISSTDPYYLITLVDDKGENHFIAINPITKDIIAKKI